MSSTEINTIVGIIGSVVGVIGIIVGIIGVRSLAYSMKIKNKVKVENGGCLNQYIHTGSSLSDVIGAINDVADKKITPYMSSLNSLEKVEEILKQDADFFIPVVWCGEESEYEKLREKGEIKSSVLYLTK